MAQAPVPRSVAPKKFEKMPAYSPWGWWACMGLRPMLPATCWCRHALVSTVSVVVGSTPPDVCLARPGSATNTRSPSFCAQQSRGPAERQRGELGASTVESILNSSVLHPLRRPLHVRSNVQRAPPPVSDTHTEVSRAQWGGLGNTPLGGFSLPASVALGFHRLSRH